MRLPFQYEYIVSWGRVDGRKEKIGIDKDKYGASQDQFEKRSRGAYSSFARVKRRKLRHRQHTGRAADGAHRENRGAARAVRWRGDGVAERRRGLKKNLIDSRPL